MVAVVGILSVIAGVLLIRHPVTGVTAVAIVLVFVSFGLYRMRAGR